MLKSDYDVWRETEYLSRGANGRELRRRMAEMEKGNRVERELVEVDAVGSWVKLVRHPSGFDEYVDRRARVGRTWPHGSFGDPRV